MRAEGWTRSRRGVTPVVATIILSAVVIAIGGAVWSYSQGAATVISNDYFNGTMTLLNEVIERFTVEHVSYIAGNDVLHVWVYNYGDIDIVVDVYASATIDPTGYICKKTLGTEVASGMLVEIEVSIIIGSGNQVAVKVHSERQNNVYYTYYVL